MHLVLSIRDTTGIFGVVIIYEKQKINNDLREKFEFRAPQKMVFATT